MVFGFGLLPDLLKLFNIFIYLLFITQKSSIKFWKRDSSFLELRIETNEIAHVLEAHSGFIIGNQYPYSSTVNETENKNHFHFQNSFSVLIGLPTG